MIAALHDHEENWFLGENESEAWINNVADEKPNLFTIGHDGNVRPFLCFTSDVLLSYFWEALTITIALTIAK